MENSIEFFLNTHLEWSLSRQDSVITMRICREGRNREKGWLVRGFVLRYYFFMRLIDSFFLCQWLVDLL